MSIAFEKMHGLGNDFVVLDARLSGFLLSPEQARRVADRRRGVGCDQIMEIQAPRNDGTDAFVRILNPDGSESGACGNGTRCVASLLMRQSDRRRAVVETRAGLLECTADADGLVTVDMGPARLDWQEIPLNEPVDTLHLPIALGELEDPVGVNIGNPHAVFFVPDADPVLLSELGPALEYHQIFPQRANIEVVSIIDRRTVRMRVWERGAGITQACGSGACATVVAAHRRGLTDRIVDVRLDGGVLRIEWRDDGHVLMCGPVATAFSGRIDPTLLDPTSPVPSLHEQAGRAT